MEKPTYFHLGVIFLQALWKIHEVVIMAPDNITFFIVHIYNISKHLICFLVCSKLGLETSRGSKAVFLWKSKVMKKRPQNVIAITIVVLMNNLFIKEDWDTPLQ